MNTVPLFGGGDQNGGEPWGVPVSHSVAMNTTVQWLAGLKLEAASLRLPGTPSLAHI